MIYAYKASVKGVDLWLTIDSGGREVPSTIYGLTLIYAYEIYRCVRSLATIDSKLVTVAEVEPVEQKSIKFTIIFHLASFLFICSNWKRAAK